MQINESQPLIIFLIDRQNVRWGFQLWLQNLYNYISVPACRYQVPSRNGGDDETIYQMKQSIAEIVRLQLPFMLVDSKEYSTIGED